VHAVAQLTTLGVEDAPECGAVVNGRLEAEDAALLNVGVALGREVPREWVCVGGRLNPRTGRSRPLGQPEARNVEVS